MLRYSQVPDKSSKTLTDEDLELKQDEKDLESRERPVND